MTSSSREATRQRRERSRPARYAGIDIGTNSIRLLVAEAQGDGVLRPVLRLGESCRLGEGMEAEGAISEPAERRTAETLERFVERARGLKPRRMHVAATHALRSARNGPEVAARLAERVELPIEVLTGEEEARLVYEGVRQALDEELLPEPCLVMDVGGGSVELARAVGGDVTGWASLPVGCVRLAERYLASDPATPEEIEEVEAHVAEQLDARPALFAEIRALAGVGGTLTALAALDLGLTRYEAGRVEGRVLEHDAVGRWSRQLAALTNERRSSLPAVGAGRADIIVAGCAVVRAVLARTGLERLVVSTRGLRYALVQRLVSAEGDPEPRVRSDEPGVV